MRKKKKVIINISDVALQCLEDAGVISSDDSYLEGYCDVGLFGVEAPTKGRQLLLCPYIKMRRKTPRMKKITLSLRNLWKRRMS